MKSDRRILRTREMLQKALIELISEHQYSTITVQDIVNRANVGRTTFYLHYNNKDELFMSCHKAIINGFHFLHSLSSEELLTVDTPSGMIAACQHLQEMKAVLNPIFHNQGGLSIVRQIRDHSAQQIETSLQAAFTDTKSTIPLNLLATYLAGAQIALVQWWLERRQPNTPEELAQTFHRLQRAAIRDAFGL